MYGLPFPSQADLPNPGIESRSLTSPALADRFFTTSTTWEALLAGVGQNKCPPLTELLGPET